MAIAQPVQPRETVLHIKDILRRHEYLFKFCRMLNPLHFVDTEAAVKAYDFMLALKNRIICIWIVLVVRALYRPLPVLSRLINF